VIIVRVDPLGLHKVTALTGEESQIGRQDSQHERFDVVHHCGILDRIPAEVIPELATSLAGARVFYSAPDITLSDVHRHGAIKEDIDASSSLPAARNFGDVLLVSRPHSAVLPDDSHDFLGVSTFVYVNNNNYAGHAPKTVADSLKPWNAK